MLNTLAHDPATAPRFDADRSAFTHSATLKGKHMPNKPIPPGPPNARFVPNHDGSFTRIDIKTGKPWPHPPQGAYDSAHRRSQMAKDGGLVDVIAGAVTAFLLAEGGGAPKGAEAQDAEAPEPQTTRFTGASTIGGGADPGAYASGYAGSMGAGSYSTQNTGGGENAGKGIPSAPFAKNINDEEPEAGAWRPGEKNAEARPPTKSAPSVMGVPQAAWAFLRTRLQPDELKQFEQVLQRDAKSRPLGPSSIAAMDARRPTGRYYISTMHGAAVKPNGITSYRRQPPAMDLSRATKELDDIIAGTWR